MSSTVRGTQLIALVEAFTEMGPAWIRWVEATIPSDAVSFARLRVLTALEAHRDGLTMTELAETMGVTRRRVTALIDAMAENGLVERYANPTDRRSTIVEITNAGREQQHHVWKDHQAKVAVAFGDLSDQDQLNLLDISLRLTAAFVRHLAGLSTPERPVYPDGPDVMLIRNNRRVRPPRPGAATP
jgi:DNA-binding MarR family transcriptional regulator